MMCLKACIDLSVSQRQYGKSINMINILSYYRRRVFATNYHLVRIVSFELIVIYLTLCESYAVRKTKKRIERRSRTIFVNKAKNLITPWFLEKLEENSLYRYER